MLSGKSVIVFNKKQTHVLFYCFPFSKKFQERRTLEQGTESFLILLFSAESGYMYRGSLFSSCFCIFKTRCSCALLELFMSVCSRSSLVWCQGYLSGSSLLWQRSFYHCQWRIQTARVPWLLLELPLVPGRQCSANWLGAQLVQEVRAALQHSCCQLL